MRPAWTLLVTCFVLAFVSRASCDAYEDSFEMSEGSGHDDDEDEENDSNINNNNSGSQETSEDIAGEKQEDRDEDDDDDDDDLTTSLYGDDAREEGDDVLSRTTPASRVEEQPTNFLTNNNHNANIDDNNRPMPKPDVDQNRGLIQPGSPYIGYHNLYGPYIGPYIHRFQSQRPLTIDDEPFSRSHPYAMPRPEDNHLSSQFKSIPGPSEHGSNDHFEYLRKLRAMIIMARLRNYYGNDRLLPVPPAQPVTFKLLKPMQDSEESFNRSQTMAQEMDTLRDRLRTLEIERIKLRTILSQLKDILNDMHERAYHLSVGMKSLNMSQREIRMARLRNLFVIFKAITKLSPLTSEDLAQINYDVGLFDPRITDDSKAAMMNRIGTILRKKAHDEVEIMTQQEGGANEAVNHSFKPSILKNRLRNENPNISGYPLEFPRPSTSSQSTGTSTSDEIHDRREILQCKLRRLRNLYLLIRPLVTGTKLSREELREIFQSREGFFEPSLTEAEKIAVVTRMADTIRMAYVSQQLIHNTSGNKTSTLSNSKDRFMNTQKNEETSSIVQPQILRPSLLIITQRLDNKPTTTDRPDKMHVSGKIQVDLNIDGDVGPDQEGLISKLL